MTLPTNHTINNTFLRNAAKQMRNATTRRGVTLLLVLALMTMFAMMIVTFMVVTTNARQTAQLSAQFVLDGGKSNDGASSMSANIDDALYALLVGGFYGQDGVTPSKIRAHSLLENLYGHPCTGTGPGANDPLKGTIDSANVASSPVTLPSGVSSDVDILLKVSFLVTPTAMTSFANLDLVGHVLTITDISGSTNSNREKLENQSTLIYQIAFNSSPKGLYLVPFLGTGLTPAEQALALSGCKFIINSPVYSGIDDPILATLDNKTLTNPDYTKADERNMFLAQYQDNGGNLSVIPSFHRWTVPQDPAYPIRPYPVRTLRAEVKGEFTGSNPAIDAGRNSAWSTNGTSHNFPEKYESFTGPWDVDNDGDTVCDSIWIDVGLPPIKDPKDGKEYKPLAAFLVLDMDGRLNVNTHGNLAPVLKTGWVTPSAQSPKRGVGSGPAEVRLDTLFAGTLYKDLLEGTTIAGTGKDVHGRYGVDGVAENETPPSLFDYKKKTGVNMNAYQYGGLLPDWWGYSELTFDPLGNRVSFPVDAGWKGTFPELFTGSPYLFNPYGSSGDDQRFTNDDMAMLLRSVGDIDFTQLPDRLRLLLGDYPASTPNETGTTFADSALHHNLTHLSSDIPAISGCFRNPTNNPEGLFERILRICGNTADAEAVLKSLPPEILRGEKVDLNKIARIGIPSIDYPNPPLPVPTQPQHFDALIEKAKIAQQIFLLLYIICHDDLGPDPMVTKTRLAQWAVNLVDFIDADGIMTPFPVNLTNPVVSGNMMRDPRPIDGGGSPQLSAWHTFYRSGTLPPPTVSSWPSGATILYGMERPEVALTKTLALHNLRIADSASYGPATHTTDDIHKQGTNAGECPNGCDEKFWRMAPTSCTCLTHKNEHDPDFDQVLPPQGSLFVELYRQGNPNRFGNPNDSLYQTVPGPPDPYYGELNLSAVDSTGKPVWRLVISKTTGASPAENIMDQLKTTTNPLYKPGDGMTLERIIRFDNNSTDAQYRNQAGTPVTLAPNEYLLIAPRNATHFESKPYDETTLPRFNEPNAVAGNPVDFIAIPNLKSTATSNGVKSPKTMIAQATFSGAKPDLGATNGDGDGLNVSEPVGGYAAAVKSSRDKPWDVGTDLWRLGTIPKYRSILLQRLADPMRPWNNNSNPYITVDWNMIDLHVINSESDKDGEAVPKDASFASPKYDFAIREWGISASASDDSKKNLWDRSFDSTKTDIGGNNAPKFADKKDNMFGRFRDYNEALKSSDIAAAGIQVISPTKPQQYVGAPKERWKPLTWNDAPLTNTMELMQVPASSSARFGFEFHDTGNPWGGAWLGSGGKFASSGGAAGTTAFGPYLNFFDTSRPYLGLLFDFVRVPSRFNGTIRQVPDMLTDKDALAFLGGEAPQLYSGYYTPIYEMREPGKINLNTATDAAWVALGLDPLNTAPNVGNDNYVRTLSGSLSNPRKTIDGDNADFHLWDIATPGVGDNPYTILEGVQRLSDVVTTRSNVFAVWITIGYFEWTPTSSTTGTLGKERGIDDGTVKRHRSFYLIDRTIPVGFRRGEKLNSKNVVVDEKRLE
ncbi:MAG: hypothetical protein ACRCUY_01525 [Thermoguttaceae bacterium]